MGLAGSNVWRNGRRTLVVCLKGYEIGETMRKNILLVFVLGAIALAGTLTYTTQQTEDAVAMTVTGDYTSVATLTFTNGWTCTAVSTGIVWAAP